MEGSAHRAASEASGALVAQHQQQVAAAVERAKQVTMTELNAIIGVRTARLPRASSKFISHSSGDRKHRLPPIVKLPNHDCLFLLVYLVNNGKTEGEKMEQLEFLKRRLDF